MAIIDETYFIADINLPTDNGNYLNKLNIFINNVQKTILIKSLGYELYKLFVAELPEPTTQRFIDIIDGADFTRTDNAELDEWVGLRNDELDSMLAYFTYVEYTKSSISGESGQGMVSNLFENSERVSPINKQAMAYNKGVEHYNKLNDFLYANIDTYPEWVDNYRINDYGNDFNI